MTTDLRKPTCPLRARPYSEQRLQSKPTKHHLTPFLLPIDHLFSPSPCIFTWILIQRVHPSEFSFNKGRISERGKGSEQEKSTEQYIYFSWIYQLGTNKKYYGWIETNGEMVFFPIVYNLQQHRHSVCHFKHPTWETFKAWISTSNVIQYLRKITMCQAFLLEKRSKESQVQRKQPFQLRWRRKTLVHSSLLVAVFWVALRF